MTERVFIGLPAYNRPGGLTTSLRSLTEQTWNEIAILVSDNASPDPAVQQVVADFKARDPRIRSTRHPTNLGAAANFKSVLDACDAPYFMWASDDDIWDPEFIESGMELLAAHPAAQMAFCTIDNINSRGDVIRSYPGFSRFNATGNRSADFERYLAESEIMGKANLIYGLFRTDALRSVAKECWDKSGFGQWGGDLVFMSAFMARQPIVASDRVLLHKRMPTDREHPIVITNPNAHHVPLACYRSYRNRHASVAIDADARRAVRRQLDRRLRTYLLGRILTPWSG